MQKRILKLFPKKIWNMNKIKNLIFILLIFPIFTFAQNLPAKEGKVYVCPLAKSMEEINPRCQCRIDLILGETVTSTCLLNGKTYEMTLTITEYEGREYYAILGFESGGAGVNFEPRAKISVPSEGYVGQEILFDGSQSFDQNGDPLDFRWNFGDGNSGNGEKVSHVYQNPGEYLITLTVDDGMASSTATATIKILSSSGVGGFVSFGTEKKISKEEKTEEKKAEEIPQKEIKKEEEKPEKITKILKIERSEKKETKEETSQAKQITETKIQPKPQDFTPFLLASLKETITRPRIVIPTLFSISVLVFILLREIRLRKRK
jgi:hypothetical protein